MLFSSALHLKNWVLSAKNNNTSDSNSSNSIRSSNNNNILLFCCRVRIFQKICQWNLCISSSLEKNFIVILFYVGKCAAGGSSSRSRRRSWCNVDANTQAWLDFTKWMAQAICHLSFTILHQLQSHSTSSFCASRFMLILLVHRIEQWFSTGVPQHTRVPWNSVSGAVSNHFYRPWNLF